ncbi:MAG: 16S rRNA (cytosine(967)-C(5))-methyltransferase, partial [Armatimonadetes bacterium]|nr:16S rRNA (cytosine(967)-C(5))-methyltransferase [Armatimonadota bacterium]
PGGKTTHLGELMNNDGGILACDRNEARLKLVARTADRLGLSLISCRPGDSRGLEAAVPAADVVLLDAPCTGSGTLARRPDLRWRLNAERLAELLPLQRELLQTAAALTRPGGVLVYATCSLEPEENEQQMAWFDGNYAEFGPEAPPSAVPPGWDSARAWATIRPEADHDGFFVARRRRKS